MSCMFEWGGSSLGGRVRPLPHAVASGPGRPLQLLDADLDQLAAPGAVHPSWSEVYLAERLVVIGVNTPEFSFGRALGSAQGS